MFIFPDIEPNTYAMDISGEIWVCHIFTEVETPVSELTIDCWRWVLKHQGNKTFSVCSLVYF